ncbi:SRPBCC family protein [Tunturiibacter empetritectus]|uniref:Ligand-binding SRPBCC domain-containing protein n=2 Tax=Tunturiibacter TaxID=3154218 RepID=A0A852VGB9_9BACT|nr:SRPBCC family protein [Edaphobacter lichenicola]NYF91863.1 ligand-binding SRPBCC domain-containing protein [Edaphobacter lichenicola]
MDTIQLETWIDAPVERCFLLCLSVDLHLASAHSSQEQAVEGITTGLISEGETVTFCGRHLGVKLRHKSRIDVLRPYSYFRDVMVSGVFSHFEHEHHFAAMDDGTRLRDEIRFTAPWGALGRLATKMVVKRHLVAFLAKRNVIIKQVAESNDWHRYLDGQSVTISIAPEGISAKKRWEATTLLARTQS